MSCCVVMFVVEVFADFDANGAPKSALGVFSFLSPTSRGKTTEPKVPKLLLLPSRFCCRWRLLSNYDVCDKELFSYRSRCSCFRAGQH
jgi:hypothetical protein